MLGSKGACLAGCALRRGLPQGAAALRAALGHPTGESFEDRFQGTQLDREPLPRDVILKRRDGWYAYHLAVVVDDAAQGVTHVVRGIDLLSLTFIHIRLQRLLGLPSPHYAHCPVLVDTQGRKLSKQRGAQGVDPAQAPRNLRRALAQLAQKAPPAGACSVRAILDHAIEHWQPERLRTVSIIAPGEI